MGCLGNSSRHGWFSTIRSMHTLLPSMAMAIWKNWNILIITHGWFGRYPIFWVGDFKYHPGWWLFGVIFLLWLGDVHSAAITPLPKASGWKKSPLNSCGSVWAFLQFCWSRQVDDCRCLFIMFIAFSWKMWLILKFVRSNLGGLLLGGSSHLVSRLYP